MPKKDKPINFEKIILERTMCLGSCPAYRIEILADGTVNYEGIAFVEKMGEFSWKIEPANIQRLQDAIDKFDFFCIREQESNTFCTDFPGCNTTITLINGKKRTIDNYYGEDSYPRSLQTFEKRIDKLSGCLVYVGNVKE